MPSILTLQNDFEQSPTSKKAFNLNVLNFVTFNSNIQKVSFIKSVKIYIEGWHLLMET